MGDSPSPDQYISAGKTAYQNGHYREAALAFAEAEKEYIRKGDKLSAAEMANNRSVALLQAKDPRGALQAVEGTEDIFAHAGDIRRQAMALANRGAALEALNRLEQAIGVYEQAAELFKEIGEFELRAPLMQSLATLQLRSGRRLEGLVTMQSGLKEIKQPGPRQSLLRKLLGLLLRWLKL